MTEQEFRQLLSVEQFAEPVAMHREAGYSLGVHDHPFEAFALITEGEFTLEVDGQRTVYEPGDTFRLPAGTPHSESAGPQGARYLSARKDACVSSNQLHNPVP